MQPNTPKGKKHKQFAITNYFQSSLPTTSNSCATHGNDMTPLTYDNSESLLHSTKSTFMSSAAELNNMTPFTCVTSESLIPSINSTSVSSGADISITGSKYDIGHAMGMPLSDEQKFDFLTATWRPPPTSELHSISKQMKNGKRKVISFQQRWLDVWEWLAYSSTSPGGWCIPCVLFASQKEKLGIFVTTPFTNYNKSAELCNDHSTKKYHSTAVITAAHFRENFINPSRRIDSLISEENQKNFKRNKEILPLIVKAALLPAKQGISLQGHDDDRIDFSHEPTKNEGNFVAILRLIAESNQILYEHLTNGPKNAMYSSKNIQNEILQVAAQSIRIFIQKTIQQTKHYSIIADEAASHNSEILSVCLRFVEVGCEPSQKVNIHEVFLDFAALDRTTGTAIGTAIKDVLKTHGIAIADCKGQAYDTTASMSARKGVQGEIKKDAPDADYQGCALHSLNLSICHSCDISYIGNMIDSFQELYSFFDKSPKRQRFLEKVIEKKCQDSRVLKKIKGMAFTRWTERYRTYESIHRMYPYILTTLEEICSRTEEVFDVNDNWSTWDAESKSKANGLRARLTNFELIVAFACVKSFLEPIAHITSLLQGRHVEVFQGFKKVADVKKYYEDLRKDIDVQYEEVYAEIIQLSASIGVEESVPRICRLQQHRPNPNSGTGNTPKDYWKITVAIPFLDRMIEELSERFSPATRAHYELCQILPEVVFNANYQIIFDKWQHVLPSPGNFNRELHRWQHYVQENPTCLSLSIQQLLEGPVETKCFPNVRELLIILACLPMGSVEAERSFSVLRRIHSWLRTTMTTQRLGNLAVLATSGFNLTKYGIAIDDIVDAFIQLHPRRMTSSSILFNSV